MTLPVRHLSPLTVFQRTIRVAAIIVVPCFLACGPAMAQIGFGPTPEASSQVQGPPPPRPNPPAFPSPTFGEEWAAPSVSFSSALQSVRDGKVDSAVKHFGTRAVTFYLRGKDGSLTGTLPASSAEMEKALSLAAVDLVVEDGDTIRKIYDVLGLVLYVAFAFIVATTGWKVVSRFVGSPARRMRRGFSRVSITFSDVAGQEGPKKELVEVVDFLRARRRKSTLGAHVPRGVLLIGPPGNGKTLLAKAVAGEASVPFYEVAGSEILEMFAGLGARRIRKIFAQLRRRGGILFIDEFDSIGGRRGSGNGSDAQNEREQILNQLLVEMDGMGTRGNFVVIAATNRSDMLDPAAIRSGRFDRQIHVGMPGSEARKEILDVHARKVVLSPAVDTAVLARMTPGFSGADLAKLVNEATLVAERRRLDVVDMACFHEARDRALMGIARPASIMSEEERRVASFHEAGHAIMATLDMWSDPVEKATILPRGESLGMVVTFPERDRTQVDRDRLSARLGVLMGGRCAEEIIYGPSKVTGGAMADIAEATRITRAMIASLAMDPDMGFMDYQGDMANLSDATKARLDHAIRQVLDSIYSRARSQLASRKDLLEALAARLRDSDVVHGDEIRLLVIGDHSGS